MLLGQWLSHPLSIPYFMQIKSVPEEKISPISFRGLTIFIILRIAFFHNVGLIKLSESMISN
jgi:hypothetical protein